MLFLSQSILQYNGGAVIAMAGKNCVGICSDTRLGIQAQTVATNFQKVSGMEETSWLFESRTCTPSVAGFFCQRETVRWAQRFGH